MSAPGTESGSGAAHGRLLLVPTPLDFGCAEQVPLTQVLPEGTLAQAAQLTYWVAENAKSARAYLKRIAATHPLACTLQDMQITELPRAVHKGGDHAGQRRARSGGQAASAPAFDARSLLAPALAGHDVGLASEAGMPGVADPGSSVVRAAHQLGLQVLPLVGPVSLLLALAASGLNGQSFAFVGYLPQQDDARAQTIVRLEQLARKTGQAQICIETPYRNAKLWQALLQHLHPDTWLSVSAGLTLPAAISRSASVAEWRRRQGSQPHGCPADAKTPAVFAFGC
ncbi:uroporphyrin-III methyltransferase [Lampropedia cohaerens]|uniref:Uroporphyrin-III methyltransferase n=1 Tax=Lampropedia cohaerens TaxID=1610491 RepID=A0A0U1Q391_9BURK|nr:SAM-dependent methyltransferase [Lampropedia cohaerens]KKW69243.1 uroporphyrin-III methyltransferase [Lampropedia cohaerens]